MRFRKSKRSWDQGVSTSTYARFLSKFMWIKCYHYCGCCSKFKICSHTYLCSEFWNRASGLAIGYSWRVSLVTAISFAPKSQIISPYSYHGDLRLRLLLTVFIVLSIFGDAKIAKVNSRRVRFIVSEVHNREEGMESGSFTSVSSPVFLIVELTTSPGSKVALVPEFQIK